MSVPASIGARTVRARGATATLRARRMAPWLAAAVVLGVLPQVFSSGVAISLLNQMGIAIVLALSYNMLLGQGGMLSFGHAVYFGLGGFIAVHAMNVVEQGRISLPVVLVPLVGALGGLFFAALFGAISTGRAGTVFAMISLGIAELAAASSLIFTGFFGGEEGVSGDRTRGPAIAGIDFRTDVEVYYLIAFWGLLAAALMYAFSRTPVGRMANAVRDNPERAEFVGYSQRWVRFVSFCAAGTFAGVAGGLFAVNYEILTEENLNLVTSGQILVMAFIGGVGYFVGPIIGAVVFTLLQSMLSDFTGIWLLYVGILFLATVMFAPAGFAGILMMHEPARRAGRLHLLVGPYLGIAGPALIALVGVVGLLEMVHFLTSAPVGRYTMGLFGMSVQVDDPLPWLICLVLVVVGWLGLRRVAPVVARAWHASQPAP
jgi:branched-chain amino acid transport system permease protein